MSGQEVPRCSEPAVPRLLAAWVPDWPILAATLGERQSEPLLEQNQDEGQRPGEREEARLVNPALEPIAIIGGRGVEAASPPARALGIRRGMRLREARSLCPELFILPPNPALEAQRFEDVMQAAGAVLAQPYVARPGLLLSGARGPAQWIGGEEKLAQTLTETISLDVGVECQVGIADSLLAAVLAAQRGVIVPAGESASFLAPWPVESLKNIPLSRADETQMKAFLDSVSSLGLRRLGDIAALDQADLSARFGPIGARAHDLASGRDWLLPRQERPEEDVAVSHQPDPPIERIDTAAFIAKSLSEELLGVLARRNSVMRQLEAQIRTENGQSFSRHWVLDGLASAQEVSDRLRWQLEAWLSPRPSRSEVSAIVEIALLAHDVSGAQSLQGQLWPGAGDGDRRRAYRSAEHVESLLGEGSVHIPQIRPGRDPRSRAGSHPWGMARASEQRAPRTNGRGTSRTARRHSQGEGLDSRDADSREAAPWVGIFPAPAPSIVLPAPRAVTLWDVEGEQTRIDAHGQLLAPPARLLLPADLARVEAELAELLTPGLSAQRSREDTDSVQSHPSLQLVTDQGLAVLAWAGPWAIDEGWWRPQGRRRRAYLQIVAEQIPPLLLVREGKWMLEALYA